MSMVVVVSLTKIFSTQGFTHDLSETAQTLDMALQEFPMNAIVFTGGKTDYLIFFCLSLIVSSST